MADSTLALPARRGEPQRGQRAGLVFDAAGRSTSDLPEQLRRRLRIITGMFAVFCVLLIAITLPFDLAQLLAGSRAPVPKLPWHAVVLLIGCLEGSLAAWLWRQRPITIERLRFVEWLSVTPVLLYSACSDAYFLSLEVIQSGAYSVQITHWAMLMVGYGVVVPNTWFRCTLMVGMIALVAFVPDLLVIVGHGVPAEPAFHNLAMKGLWLGVAGAIVVYGAYRIEVLHREVAEARKLGQYVLRQRLGVGGMGEVYLAEHVLLRRPCAIKLIRPERAGDATELLRFEREVRTMATLTHPNTVQVFDYGHAADGTFYYVMEFLPGLTLSQLVKEHGRLPAARAIHFLRQVCGALCEAHAIGLIHRDIKPGNVMVCQRGGQWDVAKLLDFGLVLPRADGQDGERLTQDGAHPGTPAYMSPEQAAGQDDLDPRSDIYGVGCLAYFLLTGQPPFAARSAARILAAHIYEPPAPLSGRSAEVSAELEEVVLRCLAKEPVDRFASVEDLDRALAACPAAGEWKEELAVAWWSQVQGPESKVQIR